MARFSLAISQALVRLWYLPLLVGLVAIGAAGWLTGETRQAMVEIEQQARETTRAAERNDLLDRLHHAIGYGGVIHHFKNYVLRGDDRYLPPLEAALREADAVLVAIEASGVSALERQAIAEIRDTLARYEGGIDVARAAIARGELPVAVDDRVRVDDTPAFAALRLLDDSTSARFADAERVSAASRAAGLDHAWMHAATLQVLMVLLVLLLLVGVWLTRSIERQRLELDAVLANTIDGIATIDAGGHIVSMNRSGQAMFGAADGALIGRPVGAVLPSGVSVDQDARLAEMAAAGDGHRGRVELVAHRADGHAFPVEVAYGVGEVGSTTRLTAVIRDLTARRELERRLEMTSKFELLNQVSASIAHDINNVLAVVLCSFELLAEGDRLDDDTLDALIGSTHRAARLLRRLLRASKVEPRRPEIVDLDGVLDGMRPIVARAVSPDIRVEFELGGTPPIHVDRDEMEDVLLNLCLNAGQAMPGGGRLVVSTTTEHADHGLGARIRVVDTGVGMTPETVEHIFDPFFTTRPDGTGLGLSMVHRFVDASGGAIDVRSRLGHGTEVEIRLPAVDPASQPARVTEVDDPDRAASRWAAQAALGVRDG